MPRSSRSPDAAAGYAAAQAAGTITALVFWAARGRRRAPAPPPSSEPEREVLEERLRRELSEFDA